MTTSTTPQLKISRTKKRLSNDRWLGLLNVLAILGLFACVTFALRATTLSGRYGVVDAELPVVWQPFPGKALPAPEPNAFIGKSTPVVLLTAKEFIFGDISAFTQDLTDIRNKFSVPHRDGAPNMDALLKTMNLWNTSQKRAKDGVIVFMPAENIPAPIVIQVVDGLKRSHVFQRVVLASGLK